MVDILSKRCIHPNCKKQPSYNLEDEKVAKYCSEHKLENMVDIVSKRCIHPTCNTRPIYNYQDEKVAKFCLEQAKASNIYDPVNYKKNPESYCGMDITDNPYYDLK